MKMNKKKDMYFKSRLITTIIVGVCGLAFLMPLLWMISASLQTNAVLNSFAL